MSVRGTYPAPGGTEPPAGGISNPPARFNSPAPGTPTNPNVMRTYGSPGYQAMPPQHGHTQYSSSSTQNMMQRSGGSMISNQFTPSRPPAGAAGSKRPVNDGRGVVGQQMKSVKKKKRLADKVLPWKVRDLVPESQAYMDLLAFERKLDTTIMRKRLDIQEALKRSLKQKRKLRIFISNTYYPLREPTMNADGTTESEGSAASWELRVEGKLLDDSRSEGVKAKRKFSSFFKSLVIELDKELYGPDNHLVEWHRIATTQETDGFQVKRPGDKNVRCTILLLLDHQPPQYKLDPRLARLLGVHTQSRPVIIQALWQYIKHNKLQDNSEREFINCDRYLEQIFQCSRMKFAEIPHRLNSLLNPPDPIVINHVITVEGHEQKRTACYDIEVEVDDTLKAQMNNFLLSTASQQEIQSLDNKVHETVELINQYKVNREFFLGFARDPQQFINKWLVSQNRDLKTMTDVVGNPEEERRSEFYYQGWVNEAVHRYFHSKVQQKRVELEQALGMQGTLC